MVPNHNQLQLRPSKTADLLIYAIKRPIFDSLWLFPGKWYAIFIQGRRNKGGTGARGPPNILSN